MSKCIKNIFSIALSILLICTFFTGCEEDDGSGYTFRANLALNPQNLDPQLASDKSSKTVIVNMMEGLVKIDENGAIVPAAAEYYEISEDELTYTFYLKDNIYWENAEGYKSKMTADDFVFAFYRIFDPNALYSPYIDDFVCIKNSKAVVKGELDKSKLGVKATSDYTLQIELEYPYYKFLELLTSTAAMPCNEEFFESTKGRYGLSAETTISNGAFYLKEWNYDPYWDNNYIIMRRNKSNSESDYVYPYSLNFFITGDSETDAADFSGDDIDCFKLENYDKKLVNSNAKQYFTKSYGLIFNIKSEYFKNSDLRKALAASFSREVYADVLGNGLKSAYGIVPNSISVMGKSYRDLIPDSAMSLYDTKNGQKLWNNYLEENELYSIDNIKITVSEEFKDADYLRYVTEQWEQNLEFYCGIEVVSQNEYDLKIENGTFDILLVEINSEYNDPIGFFDYFMADNADVLQGYMNPEVYGYTYSLNKTSRLGEAISLYTSAEEAIINTAVYVPLFYGSDYFICSENAKDIVYRPFSDEIDFRYAKYFD